MYQIFSILSLSFSLSLSLSPSSNISKFFPLKNIVSTCEMYPQNLILIQVTQCSQSLRDYRYEDPQAEIYSIADLAIGQECEEDISPQGK